MARHVSGRDIAEAAGVSQSTVSRVLTNSPRISAATRDRVHAAMERLGYRPNAAARTLLTGRSNLIGLVVSNITNPFYPEVIESIVEAASGRGYNVVLCNANESVQVQQQSLELLVEHQIDGAILTSALEDAGEALTQISSMGIPIVLVNRTVVGPFDSVGIDDRLAGRIATRHLIDLGHRSVAFVGGLRSTSTNRLRLDGYRDAMRSAGIGASDFVETDGAFTRDSGYRLATELLSGPLRPTALVCADDLVAFGALDAAADLSLDVPSDVSIVGFDDVPAASLRSVGLTTVCQPTGEIGRRAVAALVDRIVGAQVGEPVAIVTRTELIERRTSAPPG